MKRLVKRDNDDCLLIENAVRIRRNMDRQAKYREVGNLMASCGALWDLVQNMDEKQIAQYQEQLADVTKAQAAALDRFASELVKRARKRAGQ